MADDIRKKQAAEQVAKDSATHSAAAEFDRFVAQIDGLLPECVEALRELKVKTAISITLFSNGWTFQIPTGSPDNPWGSRQEFAVNTKGKWVFWRTGTGRGEANIPLKSDDVRAEWVKAAAGQHPRFVRSVHEMRADLQKQVEHQARPR
ncbi:hypothetical protein CH296_27500 [Rhodococcus sp. 14-2496-1d]|nr:hypothetical protein CH296_27500 [Rhodococcus sp. 14-2496-1d]